MPEPLVKSVKFLLPLILLLGAWVATIAAPRPVAESWRGLAVDQPHPAVVRVVVAEGSGGMSLGSGSLVAVQGRHGLIVTNWHVVRDARGPITVIFPDGFRSGASLLATDADWDLAALGIWRPNVEPIRLAQRAPQLEETLSIAGYGTGQYRSASGRCVQYISPGANHPFEMLELSTAARDGDSGGPIFNAQGELAGVLFGAARGRTAGSYCGRVQWFLNSVAGKFDALSTPVESSDTMIAHVPPERPLDQGHTPAPIDGVAISQSWKPVEQPRESDTGQSVVPSRRRELPLASIPAPQNEPPGTQPAGSDFVRPAHPSVLEPVSTLSVPATPAPSTDFADGAEPGEVPVRLSDLTGRSRPEQIKNLLAAVGVIAVVFHSLKIFSALQGGPAPKRKRPPARRR